MEINSFIKNLAKDIDCINGTLYYVGGYVRDKFIFQNNSKKDIDLEIYGISYEETIKILSNYPYKAILNEKFKTIKIYNIDISFPRKEVSTGEKHTDFFVEIDPYMSPKEASSRRDFTMNSIMENVLTGEILDFYNGIKDINNRKIALINEKYFKEDPLRPLRAIEFSCRFNFTIDEKIIAIGKSTNYKAISKERVKNILDKIILSDNISIGLKLLKEFNLFNQFFENINNVYRNSNLIWLNTLKSVNIGKTIKHTTTNPLYFMYVCFFYNVNDIKYIIEDISSLTNEKKFLKYIKELINKYPFFKDISLFDKYNLKLKISESDNIIDILKLCIVDEYIVPTNFNYNKTFKEIDKNSNNGFGSIIPLVTGKDLIKLGFENKNNFGNILKYSFNLQLSGEQKEDIVSILKNEFQKY